MALVPYTGPKKDDDKDSSYVDVSDRTSMFYEQKTHLQKEMAIYLDEDLNKITAYMEKIRSGLITDEKELEKFMNQELIDIVKLIIHRNYKFSHEVRSQAKIQPFMFRLFIFCMEYLASPYAGIFQILQMILDQTNNYYNFNSFLAAKDIADEFCKKFPLIFTICPLAKSVIDDCSQLEFQGVPEGMEAQLLGSKDPNSLHWKVKSSIRSPDVNFVKSSCIYQKVSIVYLINLNFFVQIGAAEALTNYSIKNNNITSVLAAVEIMNQLANFLEEEFYSKEILPQMIETLKTLPANLNSEEIKAAKKDDIQKLIKVVHNAIKGASFDKTQLSEILVSYELEILNICLKSQYMEKRIFAIQTLVEKVSEAERNQEDYETLKKGSSDPNVQPSNWLTSDNFILWLEKQGIAQVLLGESSHSELLRRSSPLFRFMFRKKKLDMKKIDEICKLAIEKHDTHRKYIIKILSDVAELMDYDELDELFQNIKGMSLQEIDQDILQLIKTIGGSIIKIHSSTKPAGKKRSRSDQGRIGNQMHGPHRRDQDPTEQMFDPTMPEDRPRPNDDDQIHQIQANKEEEINSSGKKQEQEIQEEETEEAIHAKQIKEEKSRHLGKNILMFLWEIILNASTIKGATSQIINNATNTIKDILGGKLEKERLEFLEKVIEAIAENKIVGDAIEILQNTLKGTYPFAKKDGTFINNKRDLILFLDSEYNLSHLIFNSLILLKSEVVNSLSDESIIPEESTQSQKDAMRGEETKEVQEISASKTKKTTQSKDQAINNYIKDFENRLKFLRFLKSSSYEHYELKHAQLLWSLLVDNAFAPKERELFFQHFTSIIYTAQNEFNILNEEVINYLFSEILLNIEFENFTIQIYHCFETFFHYLNKRYELLSFENHNMKVISLDLIGIETLWEIYLNAIDPKVIKNSQELLLRIATKLNDPKMRVHFIDVTIKYIEKAYNAISNKTDEASQQLHANRISRSLDFIVKLLQEFGELHIQKGSHSIHDAINVSITNSFTHAIAPKKFTLTLFKTMTVSEAKTLIASKLNPQVQVKEVMLMTRGSILTNDKQTLEELKMTNDQNIYCLQQTVEEYDPNFIGPQLPGASKSSGAVEVSEEAIATLQAILPDCEIDLIKHVLRKKNNDVEETASALFDPSMQTYFRSTMNDEESKTEDTYPRNQNVNQGGSSGADNKVPEDDNRVSQLISNNSHTFELFFKILNLQIGELDGKVWNLLMNLPMNSEIYNSLRNIFENHEAKQMQDAEEKFAWEEINWKNVLDSMNMPKILYSLQIIQNFTSCTILDEKDTDIQDKSQWRDCFANHGGLRYLLDVYLNFPLNTLTKQWKSLDRPHNTEARVLNNILNIMKVYIHGVLLAVAPDPQKKLSLEFLNIRLEDPQSNSKESPEKSQSQDNNPQENQVSTYPPSKMVAEEGGDNTPTFSKQQPDEEIPSAADQPKQNAPPPTAQVDEFKRFVDQVQANNFGIVNVILGQFDFQEFIKKSLDIIATSLEQAENDNDLASVIESTLQFLAPCFFTYPGLLSDFYSYEKINSIFKLIYFSQQKMSIRTQLNQMIAVFASNSALLTKENTSGESPENFFLKSLLPFIFAINTEDMYTDDYFQVLRQLLKLVPKSSISKIEDIDKLYLFAINFIRQRPIFELSSSESGDLVLQGFLIFAETLIEIEPELRNVFDPSQNNQYIKLFNFENYDIIKELYDYLFYLPGENETIDTSSNLPKCKHRTTRVEAFKLAYILAKGHQSNLTKLQNLLARNHQILPNFTTLGSQGSDISSELKNVDNYVGLNNMGCTCYMNSLLQQFFMTRPLRNTLLHSETTVKIPQENNGPSSSEKGGEEGQEQQPPQDIEYLVSQLPQDLLEKYNDLVQQQLSEDVLIQLQLVFARLQESVAAHITPRDLFKSIKTINGEKIVASVQQDVNEFFNTLTDKLESCLRNSPEKHALNDLIGGVLSNEIISLEKDYPYYVEREEAYLTIPLDVKGKQNLQEALDLYIKEDILEGDNKYFCEKYDRKIRVMKRCSIKTLPNTLCVTLKRFDFDFSSMMKVKINDFFEFPLTVNLKPWTKCGLKDQIPPEANYEPPELDDSYYEYELVGVLVHSGTADGGHYYSYIKDRTNPKKGWFEFNDRTVKPFDLKNLKSECFGGEGTQTSTLYDFEFPKSRNAYLLFYERPQPDKLAQYEKSIENTKLPEKLSDIIWRENLEVLRSRYFYDFNYFTFVMDVMKLYKFPIVETLPKGFSDSSQLPRLRALHKEAEQFVNANQKFEETGETTEQVGRGENKRVVEESMENESEYQEPLRIIRCVMILACEIYLKNSDSEQFASWMKYLSEVVDQFAPGAVYFIRFLDENPDITKLMYADNVSNTVKESIKNLLTKVIDIVYKLESSYFAEVDEFKVLVNYKIETRKVPQSALARFLQSFTQAFIAEKNKDLSKPLDYLKLVIHMIQIGPVVANFMIRGGLLEEYFDLYMQIQKYLNSTAIPANQKDKNKYHSQNILMIFRIIESLIRACITTQMYDTKTIPVSSHYYGSEQIEWDNIPPLPLKIIQTIIDPEFFRRCFLDMQLKCDCLVSILQHICWENPESSKKVIFALVTNCCGIIMNHKAADEDMKLLYNLAILNDQYQNDRLHWTFSDEACRSISYYRGNNILAAAKKSKDNYDKVHAVLTIRWIAKMTEDIPQFRERIIHPNLEIFTDIVEFLGDQIAEKKTIWLFNESELNTKMPAFLEYGFAVLSSIIPYTPKKEAVEVKVEDMQEESKEAENAGKNEESSHKHIKGNEESKEDDKKNQQIIDENDEEEKNFKVVA